MDHLDGVDLQQGLPLPPGPWRAVNDTLMGWPNETITFALLGLAGILVWIALTAPPVLKASAITYVVLP